MQFADSPQLQKELQKQEEILKSWGLFPHGSPGGGSRWVERCLGGRGSPKRSLKAAGVGAGEELGSVGVSGEGPTPCHAFKTVLGLLSLQTLHQTDLGKQGKEANPDSEVKSLQFGVQALPCCSPLAQALIAQEHEQGKRPGQRGCCFAACTHHKPYLGFYTAAGSRRGAACHRTEHPKPRHS